MIPETDVLSTEHLAEWPSVLNDPKPATGQTRAHRECPIRASEQPPPECRLHARGHRGVAVRNFRLTQVRSPDRSFSAGSAG